MLLLSPNDQIFQKSIISLLKYVEVDTEKISSRKRMREKYEGGEICSQR